MSTIAHWSSYPATGDRLLSFIGIEIHWAILQYVLGLSFMAFIALLLYLRSKDKAWMKFAQTQTKAFIIVFAVGAATGTTVEFGLVLLWPHLTEAAGRYIYFPLYMEIFAFLNIPAGLGYDIAHHKFYLDVVAALARNPTYAPLYIKSIMAAFTTTFLIVMGAYAYKYFIASSEQEKRIALKTAKMFAKPAAIGLRLMLVLGLWYAFSLENVPYKFNNVFASLGWRINNSKAYYDVSWLFVLKMILYAFQIIAVAYAVPALLKGRLSKTHGKILLAAGVIAIVTIAAGEYLNAFSQYPFFVAVWPDILAGHVSLSKFASYGINIPESALPTVINTIDSVVLLDNTPTTQHILKAIGIAKFFPQTSAVNQIAVEGPVVALTIGFLVFLLAAASYLVFYILLWPSKARTEALVETEERY